MLFILALLACSYWLRSRHREFVFCAGFAIIVFRCELAIMFGLMLLISLVYGHLNLLKLISWIIVTGVISLGELFIYFVLTTLEILCVT